MANCHSLWLFIVVFLGASTTCNTRDADCQVVIGYSQHLTPFSENCLQLDIGLDHISIGVDSEKMKDTEYCDIYKCQKKETEVPVLLPSTYAGLETS
jgi:hypothetical protein